MEKRKLAKIPSEEASDEMVRFSDRATGTHIITTREIEKDLLMLNFYPIKGLKKGKKEAQIRTFFSKNDYITQDLTTEKVKWLTAAFDRMDCISLYKYHWDRETGNRYTPNMLFWTDSDIDRMRKFFKEWSTEKDDKDWTAVTRFQDMVKQRRLDEKHAKETNPIDAVMETVKEIPEDFKKWVSEKAMSFSRYDLYIRFERADYLQQNKTQDTDHMVGRNTERFQCSWRQYQSESLASDRISPSLSIRYSLN